jgi:Spy/CpxP family protein refolding chaperone
MNQPPGQSGKEKKMNKPRNKKVGTITVLGIVILLAAGVGLATAQGPGGGMGRGMDMDGPRGRGMADGGREFRFEQMAERLDLTDEQREAIESIREKGRTANLELRKELMRLRNELQGEMLKDKPSEKAILSLNEKMGDIRTQLKANRLKTRLAVREQLTPEQRDRMLMMRGHDCRGGGCEGCSHGRGRGHGPGSGGGRGSRGHGDCSRRGL